MRHRAHIITAISLAAGLLSSAPATAAAAKKRDNEAATRLQVFLDRAQFAPGKIDGRYGEFTLRALALYRQAQGGAGTAPTGGQGEPKKDAVPDVSDLDLASIEPLFVEYTVSEADLTSVGTVPDSVPEQAKEKSLPYKSAAEAIAEKFHTDVDYLAELNGGKTSEIKAGQVLKVPNVEPFELTAVKDLKPGSELDGAAANEFGSDAPAEKEDSRTAKKKAGKDNSAQATPPTTSVKVDSSTNMLSVFDGEKLIAAYPVTIGSDRTKSPMGDWKVSAVAKMPNFRYDEAMLEKGERSENFHMLPPGPNNPVGVIWIALNKKGIGVHGTNEPDAIGRSASHGCVRLANWDVVRLAGKVAKGVSVTIQ